MFFGTEKNMLSNNDVLLAFCVSIRGLLSHIHIDFSINGPLSTHFHAKEVLKHDKGIDCGFGGSP